MSKNSKRFIFYMVSICVLIISIALMTSCDSIRTEEGGTYKISFTDSNGNVQTMNVTRGEAYSIVVPLKEGYVFKGLYDGESGGVQYVNANGLSVSNWSDKTDKTLYIKWEPIKITISFDAQGGTGLFDNLMINYDANITELPANPQKQGYEFIGWYSGATSDAAIQISDENGNILHREMTYENYPSAHTTNSLVFYARYERTMVMVSFNSGEASGSSTIQIAVLYGDTVDDYAPTTGAFAPKTVEGKLMGVGYWGINKQNTTMFTNTVTEEITVYAKWQPAIVFHTGNGDEIEPIIAVENSPITLPSSSRQGYTFGGWKDAGDNIVNLTTMPENGVLLNAVWKLITYPITYNLNGGNPVDNPTTYTVETDSFSFASPIKDGYSFDGWYENPSFNGFSINSINKNSRTGSVNLYAKWSVVSSGFIYDNMIRRSALDNVGYNYDRPETSVSWSNRHNGFELGRLALSDCVKTSDGKYLTADGAKPSISYNVTQDLNHLPLNAASVHEIASDTWTGTVRDTNLNGKRIEKGAYYVKVTYTDDTIYEKNGTNFLDGKSNGSNIVLLSSSEINSNKIISSINVVVVYELHSSGPGVWPFWWNETPNWHCSYTYTFKY